jgi:uncharacterized protein (TIGR00730 family)
MTPNNTPDFRLIIRLSIRCIIRCIIALALCAATPAAFAETPRAAVPESAKHTPRISAQFSVCVYCGASDLSHPKYAAAATALGNAFARRDWTLVWGGSETGLMGAVARGAKQNGGRVVGVITRQISDWGVSYGRADEFLTVDTMRERKLLLQTRSDAFVVLPDGLGTLDELADTLELRQLGHHDKPVVIFNQDGYYDALLVFLDKAEKEKFTGESLRSKFAVARTPGELLALLENAAQTPPAKTPPAKPPPSPNIPAQ